MNKQQAEQILMKLIGDLALKRQDYLVLEQAIQVLKRSETPTLPITGPKAVEEKAPAEAAKGH
jgi:hypothetical protein